MTTEARRAECSRCGSKLMSDNAFLDGHDGTRDILVHNPELCSYARGVATGRAAALADAADAVTVRAIWNAGPDIESFVSRVRSILHDLARAEAKKGAHIGIEQMRRLRDLLDRHIAEVERDEKGGG